MSLTGVNIIVRDKTKGETNEITVVFKAMKDPDNLKFKLSIFHFFINFICQMLKFTIG